MPALKTPQSTASGARVVDVHVVTASMLPLTPRSDARDVMVSTFRRGDIIENPAAYRPEKLAHAIDRNLIRVVPVDLDSSDTIERTYSEPDEPIELTRRGVPVLHHLEHLVDALEAEGCTVTGAEQYRAIKQATSPEPGLPPSVLDLTPAQLIEHAEHMALRKQTRSEISNALVDLQTQADREQQRIMAAEADDYLDHLRPQWNQAVAEARHVIDLGVPASATPEMLVDMAPEKVAAWSAFRSSAAIPTLERITALRTALAEKLGVAEGAEAPHHSFGITNPVRPELTARDRNGMAVAYLPPVERWLSVARDLDLVPIRSFTTDRLTTAAGLDLHALRTAAQRIYQRTIEQEND